MTDAGVREVRREKLRAELSARFDAAEETLEAVLDSADAAQQMDELAAYAWDEPSRLAADVQCFARGYGLQACWNRWITVQNASTSHLTVDIDA